MTGSPALIDGGHVTVPTFGIYDTTGNWIIEGHGVDPDISVVDDPGELVKGIDPQLERAIAEVKKELDAHPSEPPKKPAYLNRNRGVALTGAAVACGGRLARGGLGRRLLAPELAAELAVILEEAPSPFVGYPVTSCWEIRR